MTWCPGLCMVLQWLDFARCRSDTSFRKIVWAASWQNQQMAWRPAKTQISLGIRPVWLESSLSAWRNHGSLATHWAHSKVSDQTGRMPRLIWVFAGRTCHFIGFVTRQLICYYLESWSGSSMKAHLDRNDPIFGQVSLDKQCRPRSDCV